MLAVEQRSISSADVVGHMRVEDGLNVLGCLEKRVTLFSQQVRGSVARSRCSNGAKRRFTCSAATIPDGFTRTCTTGP